MNVIDKSKATWLPALLCLQSLTGFSQQLPANRWNAGKATINEKTTLRISDTTQWLVLKKEANPEQSAPDVVFDVKVPKAGIYEMITYATTTVSLPELIKKGPLPTAHIKIQIDQQRPTQRIVFDSWNHSLQTAGKFQLTGQPQKIKLWLPEGIRLGYIEWKEYQPPAVPEAAANYTPAIVPPKTRPRLWLNEQTLPVAKARLNKGENLPVWEKVKKTALIPFNFSFHPDKEMFYNDTIERTAETKAFYYLMTGDKKIGKEAVRIMTDYLSVLEFGNVKYGDITREVGRAIYKGSLVYDWCYDLLSPTQKQALYKNMMRLSMEMEIGWPPFDNSAINGHGNEAQVSRDLLAMSIAIYDEDPLPYKYTSYVILEQLVPMRKFEYQSPRHNQGVDYGAYRFGWEMHAAWLFYGMTGKPVFDENIKNLPDYWLYMRLPNGAMLHDGDVFNVNTNGKPFYWKQPQTMLLSYAYSNNPLIKGEFEREGGLPDNPVLFLLVNDPDLKAVTSPASLPLTKNFGPVLGSMIARTGWNNEPGSNDVIAAIKGGGYHFGNHQHADAGELQLFYHGMQVGCIGLYLSYGTPYDFNFNKRSISHSMMLARDPDEKLLFRTEANDGGSRFSQRFPVTPEETLSDPWFDYGKVRSSDFGPSKQAPSFSYFKADLTAAYTSKMSSYTRGFCFLNLGRTDVPAVVILTDDMTTSRPDFKKYWQINTLKAPVENGNGIVLHNELNGVEGKTFVEMLVPSAADRQTEILSGDKANSTFEFPYKVNSNKPEASAHRIMISPKAAHLQDRFLTVFQLTAADAAPLPLKFDQTSESYIITLADRITVMSNSTGFIRSAFTLNIPKDGKEYEVVLTGMTPGFWNVKGNRNFNAEVMPGKNTMVFKGTGGEYVITPGRVYETGK
ncbi:heparin/heparan-sulfate lyase [Chitinophaga arvensicola]|uniref:Heparin/heparan-sulfate lyase n=2 Tax=Chitinophaga arvensicola TaxID=29529 RepID=A0A1I0SDF9_9BACT|nr:heparin/heparan-sulfate lyase [Chitinophaga arvensicola]